VQFLQAKRMYLTIVIMLSSILIVGGVAWHGFGRWY